MGRLNSSILGGDKPNNRLEAVATGGPSIKPAPPSDDPEAVRRIQKALRALGVAPMTASFPKGFAQEPDGQYGQETFQAVVRFQQTVFPAAPGEWDGRVGKKTLSEMDARLGMRMDPLVITQSKRHVLIYFSAILDDEGLGGLILQKGAAGHEVLSDMENLKLPRQSDTKSVVGFGGSIRTTRGVDQALAHIKAVLVASPEASPGKLIIYGFSAGGVNALDLCRRLTNALPDRKVNLLITVDAAAGKASDTLDRSVPSNVLLNRNYYQTSPYGNDSRGAPNRGSNVENVLFDNRLADVGPIYRHGEMRHRTRSEAVNDMKKALEAT